MSRRSHSASPGPRDAKRPRLDYLTPDDYRNGVMLAPMVRSGALPTRLFALKHGAKLVWGPEIVDKAILHAERVVDPVSGVISYNGKSRAMFTTHPVEKPYLVYQIGSSDPALAVQAAKTVMQDVSGIDLNCGCPKPFSTHSGMGAALLSTPDLLCSILTALRTELPAHISISAKIRLLPTQEETLKLVEKIINTGVNCLTVHCRTRSMRQTERARVERLKEIVDFVKSSGKDVAVIENGDCEGYHDARRIRALTGADSVMIATAAESNPSVFSPTPLVDLESTLVPSYIRLCKYLDNYWASTKFSVAQFKGSRVKISKSEGKAMRDQVVKSKDYTGLDEIIGFWNGEAEFQQISKAIEERAHNPPTVLPAELEIPPDAGVDAGVDTPPPFCNAPQDPSAFTTPPEWRGNPDPAAVVGAPVVSSNPRRAPVPALVSGHDETTPTPMPKQSVEASLHAM